ncbi:MFS transporter [Actinomadura rupiterrae]|uniref:MFS transporter n=1 Tax=Actinomadura rupiterrae TaxID=559627 RepID=UPI0020A350DA|nr:MFS transporter [Actinomadura rupiterrae]MCP2337473.1 MFS family permease [Actinomadura rupiterrae]
MAGRQSGRHRRPPEAQATYREVFAVGEFRALWLAQALSFIGDQLAQVALAVLVYQRTGSALFTALTYALTYLPPIVGGPVLSGLADLFPRRTVMVMCDVARAVLVALMALRAMPFWMLCVLVFFTVLLGAPFTAARAALLPDVLDGDKYVAGSAINNITHQATQMLGFVAGGAIVAMVGTYQALGIDAVTFGASGLILLAGLRARPAPRGRERKSTNLWRGTRDGARLVFGDPVLRALVSFAWLCAFYVLPEGLAAPYAATFGRGAVTVGVLMSAMPTGMVVGMFVFSRFVRPTNRLRSMGWMAMLACAPLIVAGAHPPLWGVVAIYALSGVGSAYQLAANAAFVAAVPPDGRAQAFGLAQSGILAGQGLGILAGGAAAQYLGPETVVALAGVLGLSVAAMLTLTWNQIRGTLITASRERADSREVRETPEARANEQEDRPPDGTGPRTGPAPAGTATARTSSSPLPNTVHSPVDNAPHSFENPPHPLDTGAHPLDKGARPLDTGPRPSDTAARPLDMDMRPSDTGAPPFDAGVRPSDSSARPLDTGTRPSGASARPSDTGARPSDIAARPSDTGARPSEIAARPSGSSARSSDAGARSFDAGGRPFDAGARAAEGEKRAGPGRSGGIWPSASAS